MAVGTKMFCSEKIIIKNETVDVMKQQEFGKKTFFSLFE